MAFTELYRKYINQVIPNIYQDLMSGEKVKIDFHKIDLLQSLKQCSIITLIKIITVRCIKAEFVCYVGIKLLEIGLEDKYFNIYNEFYINKISGNYRYASKEIAESYITSNTQQKQLIEAVISFVNRSEE